jgi:hypothetical protein
MKLIKLAAIPAIALAAGLGIAACGSLKSAPAVTHTVTAAPAAALTPTATTAPTTPAPTTPAPVPAKTVYVQAPAQNVYVPVEAAPAALTNCGGGVYAGADTSCPFALNVEADYTGAGADYASSPVTGLSYTMNCDGGYGARGTVTCTGGDNALVEFTG